MWKDSLALHRAQLVRRRRFALRTDLRAVAGDLVLPVIRGRDPQLQMEVGQDLRELFMQEVFDHLDSIGRRGRNVCFIEPKFAGEGPDEQAGPGRVLSRAAWNAGSCTPIRPNCISMGTKSVMTGRSSTSPIGTMRSTTCWTSSARGVDIRPIRRLFRENRIISSIAGDFDHKSCWEIFTDPQLTARYFQAEERQVFRRHIPWTRAVSIAPDLASRRGHGGSARIRAGRT